MTRETRLNIRIDPTDLALFHAAARANGETVSIALRRLVHDYVAAAPIASVERLTEAKAAVRSIEDEIHEVFRKHSGKS